MGLGSGDSGRELSLKVANAGLWQVQVRCRLGRIQ